jgi:predicted NBD/HSP70 family sugar kinase
MHQNKVRVVECGGSGFRRADVGTGVATVFHPNEPVTCVEELADFALGDMQGDVVAVAFSAAGVIKNDSIVVKSPNIPWLNGVCLGDLRNETEVPVYVFNDMMTSATGMVSFFTGLDYFIAMTWSSGIGMRVVKNGTVLSDSEGGHVCIDPSPHALLCGCGRRGCVEAIAGGAAVLRRVETELKIRNLPVPDGSLARHLDDSFVQGAPWAKEIYGSVVQAMGEYLAILQDILHVPAIVWKGTFGTSALALSGIEVSIREEMRRHLMNPEWEKDMVFHFLPEHAHSGIVCADFESFLGAAQLALNNVRLKK